MPKRQSRQQAAPDPEPRQDDFTTEQANAIARLPADVALIKMENESFMAVARTQPRDPTKIVGELQKLIDAYPAAADEAIYCKPVGTITEIKCARCSIRYEVNAIDKDTACPACESRDMANDEIRRVKKYAEGLSIRAAESIRSIYGYTRLACRTEQIEDDKVKISGTLVDYAAGNITSDERIVSPWYRAKGGAMTKTPEDRFLNVVVKAEKAKLRRDVILDSVPNIVKAMFRDACEQKLKELVAPEVIDQKILPAFAEYGINPEQLDRIVGRKRALGWKEEERLSCRKILNALKHGETTAAELLADLEVKEPTEKPTGDLGSLAGRKVESEPPRDEEPKATAKPKEEPKKIDPAQVKREILSELDGASLTTGELAELLGYPDLVLTAAITELFDYGSIVQDGEHYSIPAAAEEEPEKAEEMTHEANPLRAAFESATNIDDLRAARKKALAASATDEERAQIRAWFRAAETRLKGGDRGGL